VNEKTAVANKREENSANLANLTKEIYIVSRKKRPLYFCL